MKKNNKGFTLVELIVVLVILAILAAILVPALLGWIDKAREKSVTTNAEAAYVAAQGIVTEKYGSYADPTAANITTLNGEQGDIDKLADIDESFSVDYKLKTPYKKNSINKSMYQIDTFIYHSKKAKKWAKWDSSTGEWTVSETKPTL